MHISHLSLTNYRNYSRLAVELPAGPILLRGDNAQGKTSLLEAIFFLSTTRSVHARTDGAGGHEKGGIALRGKGG